MEKLSSQENAELWKPKTMEGVSLFKAKFKKFAYKKHTHDEFAIGVIEKGFQSFFHGKNKYIADPGAIITVNPGEVHDGRPAEKNGYQYRMTYIEPKIIKSVFGEESAGKDTPFNFLSPITYDKELSKIILKSMYNFDGKETLESKFLFAHAIAELFKRHASPLPGKGKIHKDKYKINKACEFISENLTDNISVLEISEYIGMSQYHFIRTFRKTTGVPPHAYIVHQRLKKAKDAIEKGVSIVDTAALCGFSDQSHLTRKFKSSFGITPGQYKKSIES